MAEHHSTNVRGYEVEFHIYIEAANSAEKVRQLERFFQRLPDQHLAVLYPIFVMEQKPNRGRGGGTWPAGLVRAGVMGESHSANTGIPDADVETYVVSRGRGMIGLPRNRWERLPGFLEFSVFHEVGHCVNNELGLLPSGATEVDFAGMTTTRCGDGNMIVRRAVEAYARYICSPSRVYHSPLPAGEDSGTVNSRLIETLRRSPAFRSVPDAWRPR